ncbi:MAG: NnrS family protein [Proteobacteria bacterium]|nr:NnrS family protein [Pseudomonadota bacterium]
MTEAPWQAKTLLSSPYRLCFFWAGAQWVGSALWWFAALTLGAATPAVPATTLHALWFGLGAMPLFIAGFLLTAGPKWVQAPEVDAARLRPGVAAFSAGWVLAGLGAGFDARLAAVGLLAAAAGLGALAAQALMLLRRSTRADVLHPGLITASLLLMSLALAAAAVALLAGQWAWLAALARAALWWGPVAVFITASHRMLPFLGYGFWPALDARFPLWPLGLLLSAPAAQGALALASTGRGWALPPWLAAVNAAHLALVGLASAALTLRWLGAPPLRAPLLRLLHRAALWWPLSLWLLAAAAWPSARPELAHALQMAGLHALTIGYLGSTLLAMVTRVVATQQGRSQAVDRWTVLLFVLLQAAAAVRVVAALWPEAAAALLLAAGGLWLGVAAAWWLRHGRWLKQAPPLRQPRPPRP